MIQLKERLVAPEVNQMRMAMRVETAWTGLVYQLMVVAEGRNCLAVRLAQEIAKSTYLPLLALVLVESRL